MNACACHPGTFENGWMETRCDDCLKKEIAAWEGITDRARQFARTLRGDR